VCIGCMRPDCASHEAERPPWRGLSRELDSQKKIRELEGGR
jgi:hypothetical protein